MADNFDISLDDIIKKTRTRHNSTKPTKKNAVRKGNKFGGIARPHHQTVPRRPQLLSTALVISNLHVQVCDKDIYDLFSSVGALVRSSVHYNQSGNSLGTADVVFQNQSDTVKAARMYNGVPLDGQPMKIEMVQDPIQQNPVMRRLGHKRVVKHVSKPKGGGKWKNPRENLKKQKRTPTTEELDAEMDAYNQ